MILSFVSLSQIAGAADDDRYQAIRAFAAQAPALEPSVQAGSPKYQVIRLNIQPQEIAGQRYGLVRLKTPPVRSVTLVWMFADVGNIEEYEIMPAREGLPIRGNSRLIYPPINEPEKQLEGANHRDLTLPKPWDQLELHLLGVPADLMRAGEEYLIWFRFSDKQPMDILMAATFLENIAKPEPARLPAVFGLPAPIPE